MSFKFFLFFLFINRINDPTQVKSSASFTWTLASAVIIILNLSLFSCCGPSVLSYMAPFCWSALHSLCSTELRRGRMAREQVCSCCSTSNCPLLLQDVNVASRASGFCKEGRREKHVVIGTSSYTHVYTSFAFSPKVLHRITLEECDSGGEWFRVLLGFSSSPGSIYNEASSWTDSPATSRWEIAVYAPHPSI